MQTTPDPRMGNYKAKYEANPQPYDQAFKQFLDLQKASGMEQKPKEQEPSDVDK